jgi:hypothetical protein
VEGDREQATALQQKGPSGGSSSVCGHYLAPATALQLKEPSGERWARQREETPATALQLREPSGGRGEKTGNRRCDAALQQEVPSGGSTAAVALGAHLQRISRALPGVAEGEWRQLGLIASDGFLCTRLFCFETGGHLVGARLVRPCPVLLRERACNNRW